MPSRVYRVSASMVLRKPRFPHRFIIQGILKNHLIDVLDTSNFYVTKYRIIRLGVQDSISAGMASSSQALLVEGYFYAVADGVIEPCTLEGLRITGVSGVNEGDVPSRPRQLNAAAFTLDSVPEMTGSWVAKIGGEYYIRVCSTDRCTLIRPFIRTSELGKVYPDVVETVHFYTLQNRPLFQYPPPNEATARLLRLLYTGELYRTSRHGGGRKAHGRLRRRRSH